MGHSSAVELQMMRKGRPGKDGCFFHLPYLCLLWLIQNSQTPRHSEMDPALWLTIPAAHLYSMTLLNPKPQSFHQYYVSTYTETTTGADMCQLMTEMNLCGATDSLRGQTETEAPEHTAASFPAADHYQYITSDPALKLIIGLALRLLRPAEAFTMIRLINSNDTMIICHS
ncbi:hypothetical protein NQZ68_002174 [Dissostichus eleginoides]|nr:hypothetical protein NQZ68_002174 [Dissostichus eleginoides]